MSYSDYIIYADESGSPILGSDIQDFPIFVLVFLIVGKAHYCDSIVPALQRLKFDFVGHDQLVLHERDIRRQNGNFAFLQVSATEREKFLNQISEIVAVAEFSLACTIIDKKRLALRYSRPWSPYDLALTFCMEKAAKHLCELGESGKTVDVIFEARGSNEDRHLELEFRRIADGTPRVGSPSFQVSQFEWRPHFADKRTNSSGLQLADLSARPLGLRYLRPDQPNRSAEILKHKCIFPHPKVFP